MRFLVLAFVIGCAPGGSNTNPDGNGGGGDDAPGQQDGGVTSTTHLVSIIVEPDGNHGSQLVSAISAAHSSVYMTMYMIDDTAVVNALVARKQAGLDVQAVLDSSSISKSFNMSAYNTLHNAGVGVVWSSSAFTYTHEKTVMIDGTSAWIMTMNTNTSSPSDNREYLALDTDAADVAEATAVFKADHALQAVTPVGGLVVANVNARPKLVALIDSATKTLDIEGEEFSDLYSTGIVRAVVRAAMRGVTTHVIIGNSTPDQNSITLAKNGGAHVVITGPTSGNGTPSNPYIHAKAILVDCVAGTCAKGFVGSENFSGGSLGYNREVGVVFDTTAELAKMKTAIDLDFSHGVAQ
jgi:cardiolipin synthase A/B